MMTPGTYAAVSRVAALVLGAGSLAWSASDRDRIRVLIGTCEGRYQICRPGDPADCRQSIRWSGCETLVRELMISGTLLILAGLPLKRSDSE